MVENPEFDPMADFEKVYGKRPETTDLELIRFNIEDGYAHFREKGNIHSGLVVEYALNPCNGTVVCRKRFYENKQRTSLSSTLVEYEQGESFIQHRFLYCKSGKLQWLVLVFNNKTNPSHQIKGIELAEFTEFILQGNTEFSGPDSVGQDKLDRIARGAWGNFATVPQDLPINFKMNPSV